MIGVDIISRIQEEDDELREGMGEIRVKVVEKGGESMKTADGTMLSEENEVR